MESLTKTPRRALQSHFDAVVYFFTKLDVEMISDLLDDDRIYQDYPKHIFVRKLGDLFHDLQKLGDTKLLAMVDDDPLPVNGSFGVTFEGPVTALFMEVIFDVDDLGYITDIYEVSDTYQELSQYSSRQRVFIDQCSDTNDEEDHSLGEDMDDETWL